MDGDPVGGLLRSTPWPASLSFSIRVPKEVEKWARFTIQTNASVLVLELPGDDGVHGGLLIDTGGLGTESQLALAAPLWDRWVANHPTQVKSLGASLEIDGLKPRESTCASYFSLAA